MIIRRLAEAIRRQDWFTVIIEVFIVVFGVFIGLQVNQWAAERGERALEHASLERLFLEAQAAHRNVANYVSGIKRFNGMRRNAVAFVDSDIPAPENDLLLRVGVNTMAQIPPLLPVSVAYDELRSSGQLQLIRSAKLRDQIATFHANLEFLSHMRDTFMAGADEFHESHRRHVTWRYNAESKTSDIGLSTYDWDSLRADEEFKTILIGYLRNHLVLEEGVIDLEQDAKAMCDALGDAIGRSCEEAETGGANP